MRRTDLALSVLGVTAVAATSAVLSSQPTPDPKAGQAVSVVASRPQLPVVVVLGDSYAGGSAEGGNGSRGWPMLLAVRDDLDVRVKAVGGSGYVVDGQGRDDSTLLDRAGTIASGGQPAVVVVVAARNDVAAENINRVGPAEARTLATVHRVAPKARIVVVGPVWTGDQAPRIWQQFADIESRMARKAGATYIDGVRELWFKGRPDLIGKDRVHPTDAGHVVMAKRIEPAVRAALRAPS